MYDVIIVGGGVIGASIAYHLSLFQKRILVIERDKIGSHASSAAAGMLGAQVELKPDHPLLHLATESQLRFVDLVRELENATYEKLHLNQNGIIRLARTEEELMELAELHQAQLAIGLSSKFLTYDQICDRVEGISPIVKGGIHVSDGQLEASRLAPSLMKVAVGQGVEVYEDTTVLSLEIHQQEVRGVHTTNGTYYAETVVLAGGAWTNELLPEDYHVPLYPVKGDAFSLRLSETNLMYSLYTHDCYIVPKSGNRLLVGATESPYEWEPHVKMEGLFQLFHKAAKMYPAILDGELEKTWSGIRPQTKDGLPYLGLDPDLPGLIYATGHYRNGILLSAITGEIVADLIVHRKSSFDLQPFAPERWRNKHAISE
ncbi:glycine oxidase ThiO [Thermoactinomyces sp. DSM 45892]|uniref:glycine oxidase ThiO n=1 Tax=Thermoactinomyces sp. DSM 45892 TaxID=1882753 RepID=UPI00089BF325|nr:glycine oxidase ThiO [Thermoactinomyces sp. DSM 45892]SDZ03725.1 glycine oxidase [Thermoactinomyces sp. DSM 45892]